MSEKYIYAGNRDGNNQATAIKYTGPDGKAQGTVYDDGAEPEIRIGDTISLSAAERDRLSPFFLFEDHDGDIAGGDVDDNPAQPPVAPGDTAPTDTGDSTSASEGTIPPKANTSSASKK